VVAAFAEAGDTERVLTLMPGMVSPADLRHLRALCDDIDLPCTIPCDYSTTMDSGPWDSDKALAPGGTSPLAIAGIGRAAVAIACAPTKPANEADALDHLEKLGVPASRLGLPIGIRATDTFTDAICFAAEADRPASWEDDRDRLLDAYADGHKFLSGKRTLIYGDPDLVAGLVRFAWEIGLHHIVAATGGNGGLLEETIAPYRPEYAPECQVLVDADFADCAAGVEGGIDLLIGPSRGYHLARRLDKPLVRIGYPIHDRIGAARMRCCGYQGSQELFDRIVNALIADVQDANPVGYLTY
jgi:nitrogenase molybdenum-iron protein NifN